MTTPIERAKTVEISGSPSAFESANNCTQISGGWISQKKVDVVCLCAKLRNRTTNTGSNGGKSLSKKIQVSKNLSTEFRAKDDVSGTEVQQCA